MYEHVLVVTDGSHESDRAVAAAAELARDHRARLTLAAVVELEHPGRHCAYGASEWNLVLRDAARSDLDRAWQLADMPAEREILYGKPVQAVADGARALGCDVIVIPAPHRRLVGRLRRDRGTELRRRCGCEVIQPD
jgi:nucleotide-binding universal stress UspA family protein